MKTLIYVAAILLLVNACTGESPEPAPVAKTEQAEQIEQAEQAEQLTEQAESDNQVDQVEQQEGSSRKTEPVSAYQKAIRAGISNSSKDKDSNDDKDG